MNESLLPAGLTVLERGWLSANNILLHGLPGEGAVLIDTGHCLHADQTVALVEHALRALPGEGVLRAVFNTHLHSDHCGGNARLAQHFRVEDVRVPAGELDAVTDWDEARLGYRDCGQRIERFSASQGLSAGQTLRVGRQRWQVLAAPGHDPHALMLFEPESGVLISGDALWQQGFGVIFPELGPQADGTAFEDVAIVLAQIAQLPARIVIPGHGSPFGDVPGALQRARERLDRFRADPKRHARHAAKVLLKYHVMEERQQLRTELETWAVRTPLMAALWTKLAPDQPLLVWLNGLLDDLVHSAALHVRTDADGLVRVIDGPFADPASPARPR
jgi:glyoxylase-like metal-dependent hydrolase (beta-lactamase superfamily II)